MKTLLLFTVSALIVGNINARILFETQHSTNDLDRQIAELYRTRDGKDGLDYLNATKQYLKSKTRESVAAATEYFKAPGDKAGEQGSNALILAQERLAAAAEYLKTPELPKQTSRSKVENALAAATEYFKAPELQKHNKKVDRVADSLAAAAEYLKTPELPKQIFRNQMENASAAAAEYFRAPESPKHHNRNDRTAESLAASAVYFRTPEYRPKLNSAKKNFAAA